MYNDNACVPNEGPTLQTIMKDIHGYLSELEIVVDQMNRNLFGVEPTGGQPNDPHTMIEAFADDSVTANRILKKTIELSRRISG